MPIKNDTRIDVDHIIYRFKMFFLFVLFILFLVYYKINKRYNFWRDQKVLCTKPTPFIGHTGKLLLGKQSFFDYTLEMYQQFPKTRYHGYFQFFKPVLLVKDLELIKQICIKDFEHFSDHQTFGDEKLDEFVSKDLFSLRGQDWKEMRCTMSPAFTSSKMRGMFIFMCEISENLVNYLMNKKEEVVEKEMVNFFFKFTNDVILSAVFGVSLNSYKDPKNDFYQMGISAAKHFSGFQPILSIISPTLYKLFGCKIFPDNVTDFFSRLVKDNMQQREKYNIIRPDMIHLLREAQKGRLKYETVEGEADTGFATAQESLIGMERAATCQKTSLTHDDIVAQVLIFFFSGFETVSTVASLMAYEIAMNPDVQHKLQSEIAETLKKCDGKITYEELLSMKYLDQVVSESLRKWPAGFHIERLCTKDYEIPPATSGEPTLTIKKGQEIIISIAGTHRDPEYFPEPMKFDPDRFSDENKSKIVPGSYMPFGLGPRNCIASRFALLEIKVLFFHILRNFDLVPVKKTQTTMVTNPKQFNVAPKGGLYLGFRRRD